MDNRTILSKGINATKSMCGGKCCQCCEKCHLLFHNTEQLQCPFKYVDQILPQCVPERRHIFKFRQPLYLAMGHKKKPQKSGKKWKKEIIKRHAERVMKDWRLWKWEGIWWHWVIQEEAASFHQAADEWKRGKYNSIIPRKLKRVPEMFIFLCMLCVLSQGSGIILSTIQTFFLMRLPTVSSA